MFQPPKHRSTAIPALLLAATLALPPAVNAKPVLVNGGFEAGNVVWDGTWGTYCYSSTSCAATGWSGSYLLTAVGSWAWGYPNRLGRFDSSLQGAVVAGLQATEHVQQTLHVDQAGQYTLTWRDAGRPSSSFVYGPQDYDVLLDGIVHGSYHTNAGQAWSTHTLVLDLAVGDQVLDFKGKSHADATAFLDSMALVGAAATAPGGGNLPEPASLALSSLAMWIAAVVRRRSAADAGR